ncbi:MAG: hypothetical protein JW836_15575 [Deltaproteobacteria bacterium]|nr:hypothetical protein [Deltaproteobacteria bacterium]
MADINDAVVYPLTKRGEEDAFKMPIRKIYHSFPFWRAMGQYEAEEIARIKVGFHLAVRAGKKMVCFLQNNGGATLGALVVDEYLRIF